MGSGALGITEHCWRLWKAKGRGQEVGALGDSTCLQETSQGRAGAGAVRVAGRSPGSCHGCMSQLLLVSTSPSRLRAWHLERRAPPSTPELFPGQPRSPEERHLHPPALQNQGHDSLRKGEERPRPCQCCYYQRCLYNVKTELKADLRTDLWAEGHGLSFSVADVSEHLLLEQVNRRW